MSNASTFMPAGNVVASIVIPAVATITVSKGIITAVV